MYFQEFQPASYGPVLEPLVSGDRNDPLDAGRPDEDVRSALELATVEAAFAQSPLRDRDMAAAVIAGVWLLHDFLDESHRISQSIDTPTGAFWHGIMHRREGDYSNAKYWFRRVGAHEVLGQINEYVAQLKDEPDALLRPLLVGGRYDPFAMIDACEAAVRGGGPAAALCRRVQQAEWELLFDHSYRHAVAE